MPSDEYGTADLSQRLYSISNDPNYTLTQANGQRIYRRNSSSWFGPEPNRNCEVFVGRIPHDVFEDELIPMFSKPGNLFEFRLMINFSGYNRGYAFAMYEDPTTALKAVREYDNYFIREGWQLGVMLAHNNCRLVVSRLPPGISSEDIARALHRYTEDIAEVRVRRALAPALLAARLESCSVLVEYKTHRGAAMARKALVAAGNIWGGTVRPSIEWWPHDQSDARYRELCRYDAATGRVQVEYQESPPEMSPQPRDAYYTPGCPSTYKLDWSSRERRKLAIEQAEAETAARAAAARLAEQLALLGLDTAGRASAPPLQRTPLQRSSQWPGPPPPPFARFGSSSSSSLSEASAWPARALPLGSRGSSHSPSPPHGAAWNPSGGLLSVEAIAEAWNARAGGRRAPESAPPPVGEWRPEPPAPAAGGAGAATPRGQLFELWGDSFKLAIN